MANREKGEVEIEVKGKTYVLALDINAMAWLEDRLSTPEREISFHQFYDRIEKHKKISDIRLILWAALQKHHPASTVEDAGNVMQAAGGLIGFSETLRQKISQLSAATVPDREDMEALGVKSNGTGNPRKAQPGRRGRGGHSTSTRAASV